MRLLAISIGTLVCLGLVAGTVYFWGAGRVFPKYDHPVFQTSKPIIVLPWSFQDDIQAHPEVLLWADVRATKNDTLLVDPWDPSFKNQKNPEENASSERPLLVDLLNKYAARSFILNITSNSMNIHSQVLSATKTMAEKKKIAVQSEFDIVIRAMKESFADLPYGSSQSDRLRFNFFSSMAPWPGGLLPAAPFRGDFYVAPLMWRKIPMMSADIMQELHRRQKIVILGPLQNEEELNRAKGLGADGYFFGSESLFKTFSTAHVAP